MSKDKPCKHNAVNGHLGKVWHKTLQLDPYGKVVATWSWDCDRCGGGYLTNQLGHALEAGLPGALA